jgi:hypothetical protein
MLRSLKKCSKSRKVWTVWLRLLDRSWQVLTGLDRSWQVLTGLDRSWQVLTGIDRSWQVLTGLDRSWQALIRRDWFFFLYSWFLTSTKSQPWSQLVSTVDTSMPSKYRKLFLFFESLWTSPCIEFVSSVRSVIFATAKQIVEILKDFKN